MTMDCCDPAGVSESCTEPIHYRIDAQDRLIEVSGPWNDFACVNGSTDLEPESVCGRSLWSFIVDETTQAIYRALFAHVREKQETVVFPYRCDSPTLRRFMQMTVTPEAEGGLAFVSETVRVQKRQPRLSFAYQHGARPMVFRCSFCNAMRVRGRWADVADAVQEGLVLNHDLPVAVGYGVCASCRGDLSARLGRIAV
jgi:hypothetical protein